MLGLPGPSLNIGLIETAGRLGIRPPDLPPWLSAAMPKLIEPLGKLPGFRRSARPLPENFLCEPSRDQFLRLGGEAAAAPAHAARGLHDVARADRPHVDRPTSAPGDRRVP